MSIRIHALAKELNVTSKDLIDFINQHQEKYGLEIKTPSNAIAPLYADAISKDFSAAQASQTATPPQEETTAEQKTSKVVKTADDVEREKAAEAEVAEKAKKDAQAAEEQPEVKVVENEVAAEEPVAEEKKSPAAVAAPTSSRPAPAVPPIPAPRPKISMPEVRQAPQKQEHQKQPEVVVRMEPKRVQPQQPQYNQQNRPSQPTQQTNRAPAAVPPSNRAPANGGQNNNRPQTAVPQTNRPAAAVPPMNRAPMAVPPVNRAPAAVPPVNRAPTPMVPPIARRAAAPEVPQMPSTKTSSAPTAPAKSADGKKKVIQVKPPIIVRDFAKQIEEKPFRLISELMGMGIFASMNQAIEENIALRIAQNHGYELDIHRRGEQQQQQLAAEARKREMARQIQDDIKNYVERPAIVCILGHVDHGKTTLLDTIRHTNVVAGEAGGITQHTAAYQVECKGKKITFLDTPGHAAFSKMRERGANVTDIAILVVAADDGFMPQTDEALAFAQKAGVPVVVAINKMDAKGANIERVKQQMQKRGIVSEDWGGETLCSPISALKGENIDKLLELVILQAEMMELKANPKGLVEGIIIESQLESGRGATSTVIVNSGTLKNGDVLVCGENWCKVRALLDDKGQRMQQATPSTPAIVMGWSGAPEAGDEFKKVKNDREAREMCEETILERKKLAVAEIAPKPTNLEELMAAIEHKDKKVFKCIVKSDVSGTVEALVACLESIKSDKVDLEVISQSVGQITKNDVDFAATAGASIVAFNVKQENGVAGEAKHKGVTFITHNIIYELITQVRDGMKNLLDPELRENKLGAAEVRALFSVSKGGKVAGCMVTEGNIKRDKYARVFRKSKEIAKGRVSEIKRFKDDVTEVRAGYECGITLNNFSDFEPADIIECFEILEIRPDL